MFEKSLPARPSLEQYKKQAKELVQAYAAGDEQARARIQRYHPRLHQAPPPEIALTDAQLVLAREHGFVSWPKFQAHVTTLELVNAVAAIDDPATALLEVAVLPRHAGHTTGTLEHAELILARYPEAATANIYTAAVLGDEATVRRFLVEDPSLANAEGGPHGWDALTHLCFSRFLQLDPTRSEAFERTAKLLLDSGAKASTGWWETIDWPKDRRIFESALYAASSVARHPGIVRLLLEHGADPNADDETAYHVSESYDNMLLKLLLDSGRMNAKNLAIVLVRKADWHDEAGMRMTLEAGGDPNFKTIWGNTPLLHALERDNRLPMIELLLQYGGDPLRGRQRTGQNPVQVAAFRGRGDVLRLFGDAAIATLTGLHALAAAAALGDCTRACELAGSLRRELAAFGPTMLARAAGNGNTGAVRCLLQAGVPIDAAHPGDPYFGVWGGTTALHSAAWRAQPECVRVLLDAGANPNVKDAHDRTPLQLAVKATVDSYWKDRRTPESIAALLQAGATTEGITLPTGYDEADKLLVAAGLHPEADSR